MTDAFTLANALLVLPGEIARGSLRVEDGMIASVDQGAAVPRGAIDCGGDFVAPGLIELHTDNLERHMQPRPKVDWPHTAAMPRATKPLVRKSRMRCSLQPKARTRKQ